MKVIDLLNKIANGDIPKKIKYDGTIYIYDNYKGDKGYVDKTQFPYKWFEKEIDCDVKQYLNDEVEILEEKKIPEKLEEFDIQGLEVSGYSMTQAEYLLEDGVKENREMINWILDYLKSKGE